MFKYLHRDGDGDIPLFDLIKREIREMKRQKLLAKDKFDKKTYRKFRKWITYYHKGMFFKPDLSREVKQIEICERENLILNFRKIKVTYIFYKKILCPRYMILILRNIYKK